MPTITKDNSIFQFGIGISAVEIGPSNTGDPYVVNADGSVISTNGRGIFLNGAGQTYAVTVNGVVSGLGAGFDGFFMSDSASTATITVGELGRVAGNSGGIWLQGAGTITNLGLITGNTDAGIVQIGTDADLTIDNQGMIVSENQAAIQVAGNGVHTITNSGTLKGALGGHPSLRCHGRRKRRE